MQYDLVGRGRARGRKQRRNHACAEGIKVWQSFAYRGNVVYDSGGSHQGVLRGSDLAQGVADSLNTRITVFISVQEDKGRDLEVAYAPNLAFP